LDIQKALQVSKTLSDPALKQIDETEVDNWLGYWMKEGFLAFN